MIRRFFAWLLRGPQCAACDDREINVTCAQLRGWALRDFWTGG